MAASGSGQLSLLQQMLGEGPSTGMTKKTRRLLDAGKQVLEEFCRTVSDDPTEAERTTLLAKIHAIPGCSEYSERNMRTWFTRRRQQKRQAALPIDPPHDPRYPSLTVAATTKLATLHAALPNPPPDVIAVWSDLLKADSVDIEAWIRDRPPAQTPLAYISQSQTLNAPHPPSYPAFHPDPPPHIRTPLPPHRPASQIPHLPTPAESTSPEPHHSYPSPDSPVFPSHARPASQEAEAPQFKVEPSRSPVFAAHPLSPHLHPSHLPVAPAGAFTPTPVSPQQAQAPSPAPPPAPTPKPTIREVLLRALQLDVQTPPSTLDPQPPITTAAEFEARFAPFARNMEEVFAFAQGKPSLFPI